MDVIIVFELVWLIRYGYATRHRRTRQEEACIVNEDELILERRNRG